MPLAKQPAFALGVLLYEVATGVPPIMDYGRRPPQPADFEAINWSGVKVYICSWLRRRVGSCLRRACASSLNAPAFTHSLVRRVIRCAFVLACVPQGVGKRYAAAARGLLAFDPTQRTSVVDALQQLRRLFATNAPQLLEVLPEVRVRLCCFTRVMWAD